MFRLNNFPLPKNEGVNRRAAGGASKKPSKNVMNLRQSRL